MEGISHIDYREAIIAKLDELISVIIDEKISPKIPINKALWNTKQVADYLGLTYKYTGEHIVTHYTFPNALRMPTKNESRGYPR